MARKPLEKGLSVAANVLKWGTGGINVDGCRISTNDKLSIESNNRKNGSINFGMKDDKESQGQSELGRFPANLILDDSEEIKEEFDKYGVSKTKRQYNPSMCAEDANTWGGTFQRHRGERGHTDEGTVARFFYCAKASVEDREEGLDGFDEKFQDNAEFRPNHLQAAETGDSGKPHGRYTKRKNNHPTVKNTPLMMYLCRLITPKNGIILDPFTGSGSTGKAAILEGFNFIGCEQDLEYVEIANARIQYAISNKERLIKKYSTSVDSILPKKESISNKPEQTTEFL